MYISEMFTRDKGSTVRRGPKPSAGAQIGWSRQKGPRDIISQLLNQGNPFKYSGSSDDVKEATLFLK